MFEHGTRGIWAGLAAVAASAAGCSGGPDGIEIVRTSQLDGPLMSEFPVPTPGAQPRGIVAGPDGNLWFAERGARQVARMTPTGHVTEFPLSGDPDFIAAGPDGNLWLSYGTGNEIGRITPTGTVTDFPVPTENGQPRGIAAGPDGNVWFTEASAHQIGRITPDGVITEFPTPTPNSKPWDIAAGPDGNLWFTELGAAKVAKITRDGLITEFSLLSPNTPNSITTGPDGNVWFTLPPSKIGRITPTGTVTEFLIPGNGPAPLDLVTGPDQYLWITEAGGLIGRMAPDGTITEFPVPGGESPIAIAVGPDDNLWFTQSTQSVIGRFNLAELGALSRVSVDFGDRLLGASTGTGVKFTNQTAHPVALARLVLSGDAAGDYQLTDDFCSNATLGAGAQCTVDVRFSPSATGARSATLSFPNNGTDPGIVQLSGRGIEAADVQTALGGPGIAPSGGRATYVITVSNAGPSTATNVVMNTQVPPNTKLLGVGTTLGRCSVTRTGAVRCTLGDLGTGGFELAQVTLRVVVNKDGNGNLVLSAQANSSGSSATIDPTSANNVATLSTAVTR